MNIKVLFPEHLKPAVCKFAPVPQHHPILMYRVCRCRSCKNIALGILVQGGSNMTGTDLCVNKLHCAAAVRL
jgi:hypothetical protein